MPTIFFVQPDRGAAELVQRHSSMLTMVADVMRFDDVSAFLTDLRKALEGSKDIVIEATLDSVCAVYDSAVNQFCPCVILAPSDDALRQETSELYRSGETLLDRDGKYQRWHTLLKNFGKVLVMRLNDVEYLPAFGASALQSYFDVRAAKLNSVTASRAGEEQELAKMHELAAVVVQDDYVSTLRHHVFKLNVTPESKRIYCRIPTAISDDLKALMLRDAVANALKGPRALILVDAGTWSFTLVSNKSVHFYCERTVQYVHRFAD